jgi:decaprenylphospho-beta-D-erythro-pentofuranosid-2-ulose 2-reductase
VIDAFGAPQSLLVLGASSDIATATLERLARGERLRRVELAGRSVEGLAAAESHARGLAVSEVRTHLMDATDTERVAGVVDEAFATGDIDVVLVAFGVLPDQQQAVADPGRAVASAQVNYLGAMAACIAAATHLRRQGHGTLVVLSSVAGQRPRRSNFVYGSAKAGLDAVATGLGDDLHGSGASVLVVRPGFVHSAMTQGLPPAPLATTPEVVADAIADNLTRGSRTIWVPRTLRPVMAILGAIPRPLFRRLPL